MAHEDLSLVASSLSFSTVLSLIPFLAVTLAALNYFDGLETLTPKVEGFLLENFSGTAGSEGVQLLKKGITRIQSGRLGSIGAFVLILTATRMLFELEKAFHRIWQIRNRRPLLTRFFYYWLFLLAFPFALALWVGLFAAKSVGEPLTDMLPFKSGFLVAFALLFFLQKWLPSQKVKTWAAFIGTLFSTALLWLLERTYKWASVQIFSYSKVYGSLAAIPASLLWILMVWMAILWGVALTAAAQKGRALT